MNTLDYYNRNAETYAQQTVNADVSDLYKDFEKSGGLNDKKPLLPRG